MEKFKELLKYAPFIYLGVISLIAIIITCYDKIAAKHFPGHRTPEATLLAISAIGGSVAMYLTMQIIRHKTQHKKIHDRNTCHIFYTAFAWLWRLVPVVEIVL
ncbi:MAG: DUF1294 domain-containing protein [Eubacteriales bacterium]|nr:DUF1294 domain-containing protein [Eubacteriales bacterium]